MRKLISFTTFIFLSFIIFTSCEKEQNHEQISHLSDPNFVSIDRASRVAENINRSEIVRNAYSKTLLKSFAFDQKRKIKNIITLVDNRNNPYLYVINFDSIGYAILPSDRRTFPILGYSEDATFDISNIPNGLLRWLDVNANNIKYIRDENLEVDSTAAMQWSLMECPEAKSTNQTPCLPPDPVYPITVSYGPYLQTTWGQMSGYNAQCPVANDGPDGHAYTGCVATAVAQVMYYWAYPVLGRTNYFEAYNWSQMALTTGSAETARLMADVGKYVGTSYRGTFPGSTALMSNIVSELKNVYTYNTANYTTSQDLSIIRNNLSQGRPLILGACTDRTTYTLIGTPDYIYNGCHTWVCDGYVGTTYSATSGTYEVFHMNWGEENAGSSWCYFRNWNMYDNNSNIYNFQYNDEMIYNIHP